MGRLKEQMDKFASHDCHPVVQFIKYGISGAFATAVHIVVFYIFAGFVLKAFTADDIAVKWLHFPVAEVSEAIRARNAMVNNVIVFFISNFVAYVVNVKWVFKSGRHSRLVEIALFYAVSAVSLAVGTPLMGLLIKFAGLSTTVAFIGCIVASVLINYAMRKFVIFKG